MTIDAEPILVNGKSVAPLEASLALQSIVSGGFTKTGAGVLQLNSQDIYTGATNISAGMLNTESQMRGPDSADSTLHPARSSIWMASPRSGVRSPALGRYPIPWPIPRS